MATSTVSPASLAFFKDLQEGEIVKVDQRGHVTRQHNSGPFDGLIDLNIVWGVDEWYEPINYGRMVELLLSPILTFWQGLALEFVQACEADGRRLRILSDDYQQDPHESKLRKEEWQDFDYFEFKVVRVESKE